MVNYYEVIGVSTGASEAAIHQAYRLLALRLHPDSQNAASGAERFKQLNIAHQVLTHARQRAIYDAQLLAYLTSLQAEGEALPPQVVEALRQSSTRPKAKQKKDGAKEAKAKPERAPALSFAEWLVYFRREGLPFVIVMLLMGTVAAGAIFFHWQQYIEPAPVMDLRDRHLQRWPQQLNYHYEIVELDLAHNQISELPIHLAQLHALTRLDLSENRVKVLPYTFFSLFELRYLNLAGNQIYFLPERIGNFKNLKWLDLSGNKLRQLPPELAQLQSLKVLDLTGNPLLPGELAKAKLWLPNTEIRVGEVTHNVVEKKPGKA